MAKENFGEFLSRMAKAADGKVSAAVLEEIREEVTQEQKAVIKAKLLAVYKEIESRVARLANVRAQEAAIKKEIKELEERANNIVEGKS